MYNRDQKVIGMLSKGNPKATKQICIFVADSVRNQFTGTEKRLKEIKKFGAKATALNNKVKNNGYKYIQNNYKHLHEVIHAKESLFTMADKLVALTEIPGIGLVKAGFILQLCLGKVGCIDCHNALRFDVNLDKFKLNSNTKLATKIKKAQEYIELCDQAGGSRKLWNGWCAFIATKYPSHFDNANDVSRVHADAIVSVM